MEKTVVSTIALAVCLLAFESDPASASAARSEREVRTRDVDTSSATTVQGGATDAQCVQRLVALFNTTAVDWKIKVGRDALWLANAVAEALKTPAGSKAWTTLPPICMPEGSEKHTAPTIPTHAQRARDEVSKPPKGRGTEAAGPNRLASTITSGCVTNHTIDDAVRLIKNIFLTNTGVPRTTGAPFLACMCKSGVCLPVDPKDPQAAVAQWQRIGKCAFVFSKALTLYDKAKKAYASLAAAHVRACLADELEAQTRAIYIRVD